MSIKKDKVNITYEALWFKIFMDSNEQSMYEKEVFVTQGLSGNNDLFMQMIGNVGGYARQSDFDKDIDVVIFSDKMMSDFKGGYKDPFIQSLEDAINANNTPLRKLRFTTEELLLDYFKSRATSRLNQDKKDAKGKNNSSDLKQMLEECIEEDKVMLDILKKYGNSFSNPIQKEMF